MRRMRLRLLDIIYIMREFDGGFAACAESWSAHPKEPYMQRGSWQLDGNDLISPQGRRIPLRDIRTKSRFSAPMAVRFNGQIMRNPRHRLLVP